MQNYLTILFIAATVLLLGCKGSSETDLPDDTTPAGIHYKVYASGNETGVQPGEYAVMHMENIAANDSVYYTTYGREPIYMKLTDPSGYGDPLDLLKVMHVGDSAVFYLSTDSLFKKHTPPNFIKYGEYVRTVIKLIKSIDDAQYEKLMASRFRQKIENELMVIRHYLDTAGITDYVETESGIIYTIEKEANGPLPQPGNQVKVNYTGKLMNGEVFDTSERSGRPYQFTIDDAPVIEGWHKGIPNIPLGAKGTIYIPPSLGYGKKTSGKIPPNSPLIFEVEVVDLVDPMAFRRIKAMEIEDYLKARNIHAEKTKDLLYYKIDKLGNGNFPHVGQTVEVHYKGTLMNGQVFDSSYDRGQPFKFQIGVGTVIKGWDMGIPLFSEGGKGTLYIPSDLAYGENSVSGIPANSNLVFDIEIISVK
jgi:FKBP-type peptidyl-prolyl cis-trans isomerase